MQVVSGKVDERQEGNYQKDHRGSHRIVGVLNEDGHKDCVDVEHEPRNEPQLNRSKVFHH